jgi:hypothetical protein
MHKIIKTIFLIGTLYVFLTPITACTTATLITGMSAAPSGVSSASGLGTKVRSYQIVRYEDAVEAAQRAADTLALENQEKDIKEDRAHLRYMDEKEEVIDILIERRTATITFIQVDAGFFGPKGMSRLMLLQILDEIEEAGDFLEKWTIKEPG